MLKAGRKQMTDAMLATLLIIASVISDVLANVFLKKSRGFKIKKYGFAAIALVGAAFLFLAKAISVIDLSIAYSLFGAFGLILTTMVDKIFYGLKIKPVGVLGLGMMIAGIVLVKMV